jgi:hypothetical protein
MAIPDVKTKWKGQWGGGATAGLMWGRVSWDAISGWFIDALNERVAAAMWHRGPWPNGHAVRGKSPSAFVSNDGFYQAYEYGELYSPVVPVPEYSSSRPVPESYAPLQAGPVAGGIFGFGGLWARLQWKIGRKVGGFGFDSFVGLMGYFSGDLGNGWWSSKGGPNPGEGWSATPPPNGYRRRFPREIWSLSNPGVAKQVARFVVHVNTRDYQATPNAVGNFPAVTTPEDQYQHAGKIFVRSDAGAWVESTDPAVFPDVVEKTGFAQPGDTFGPWIAEDIRAQLNACEVTFVRGEPGYSGLPPPFQNWMPHYNYFGITMTAPGDTYSASWGLSGALDEVVIGVQDDDPYTFEIINLQGSVGIQPMAFENSYWVRTRYRVYSDQMPIPPTGAGCVAQGFVWAENLIVFGTGSSVIQVPFDAHGDLVAEDTWSPLGAAGMANGQYQSDQQGSLTPLAPPHTPAGLSGYIGIIGLKMRWGVVGGFKYSAVSPADD